MQGGGEAVSRAPVLDESLARAHQLAVSQGHGTVALEHLLFALTDDADAVSILTASRISIEQLRIDVSGHLGRMSEVSSGASGGNASAAPRPGADLLRILQLAGMAARQSQRRLMDGGIVIAAVIGDGNSPAAGLLKAHGLTFEDVIRVLQTAGGPRQEEIAPAAKRAELPPPHPAPASQAPTLDVQAPLADVQPTHDAPRSMVGEDALANARARIRQSELAATKAAPPQTRSAAAEPDHARQVTPPALRLDLPPQNAQPSALLQPNIRPEARFSEPHFSEANGFGARPSEIRSSEPRQGSAWPEPAPDASRSIATRRPDFPESQAPRQEDTNQTVASARLEQARLEQARFEQSGARTPAIPSEPITVPVVAPPVAQPLSRLRPNTTSQPQPYQTAQPVAPPRSAQRPDSLPQFRPIPAVAPRPHTPYASLPPPGPPSQASMQHPVAAQVIRSPMPQRGDLPPLMPQLAPMQQNASQMPPLHALMPREPLEIVQAAAGLPAVVRRNTPVLVEIRVPRSQVDVPRNGPHAAPQNFPVVRAVTTRLISGPVSGLSIEPRTPETAWLSPADADNRDVIWQYVLLPTRAGTFAVTLSIAGRTLSPAGMTNDAGTAAETFAVRVKPERGRFWRRLFGTVVLLLVGGAIGWALTGPLAGLLKALLEMARG